MAQNRWVPSLGQQLNFCNGSSSFDGYEPGLLFTSLLYYLRWTEVIALHLRTIAFSKRPLLGVFNSDGRVTLKISSRDAADS